MRIPGKDSYRGERRKSFEGEGASFAGKKVGAMSVTSCPHRGIKRKCLILDITDGRMERGKSAVNE